MTDDLSYDRSYENADAAPAEEKAPVPPVTEKVYSAKECIFALLFTFAGYFFIKLFILADAGIGAAVFMLCLGIASMVFMKLSGVKQNRRGMIYFAAAMIFSANIGISANGIIRFLNFIFASGMYAMWAFSVNNPSYNGADDSFVYCFGSAIFGQSFGNIGKCPAAALSATKKSRFGKNVRLAFLGVLTAVPVTLTVIVILSSADDMFGEIMGNILDVIRNNFLGGIMKYAFGLPLSFLIFGIVYAAASSNGEERINLLACRRNTSSLKFIPAVMMYSSAVPLCVVYVIFFFSQLSYFTSAFRGVLPEAFSAAEYARKGFFELCAVSVINLFVITALNLFCKYGGEEEPDKRPAALKFFTVLISAFTLVLIATALSKMAMYISRFGLTRLRVYTSWFMVLLAVLFTLIIIRQFRVFNLAKYGTVIFTVMLAALSFLQTDALIAEYNIRAYKSGYITSIDFSELSADAVYAVGKETRAADDSLRRSAVYFIKDNAGKNEEWYEKSLSEFILGIR